MTTTYSPNLIIGAGPAGLAMAGCFRKRGIDFEILEQQDKIAFAWYNHYDRLSLHTVKQFSYLPHKDFPTDYPLYVPRKDLVRYFESYAENFDIKPHFQTEVTNIKRGEKGTWEIRTNQGQWESDHVIVATGLNRLPHFPTWKGQENFGGEIIHSRAYRNPQPFLGKKVLVIGFGNTGAEIALDLAEHEIESHVVVRSPINIVPRDLNGRPTQVTAKQLAKLPFGLGDWLGTQIRKIYLGDLRKYGIQPATVHPAVQLRETGKTPVIDLGTIDMIKAGKITVVPDIDHFTQNGAVFTDGREIDFDVAIACTGYKAKVEEFVENGEKFLDKYHIPRQVVGEGEHEGIYFLGFDNYKLGGILGTIFTDSQMIAEEIARVG